MENTLTTSEAVAHCYRLYERWIGALPHGVMPSTQLDRVHKSMLDEWRYQRTRPDRKDVAREIKGELVLLGKLRKALATE